MEYNTDKLSKDEFIKSIEKNLENAANKKSILQNFINIFDCITNQKYRISYVPIFRDTRYYEIKNNDERIVGQIFCSNNQSNLYMLNDDYELTINFSEHCDDNNSKYTLKEIKYNLLNKIDENDDVVMSYLDRLDPEFKPMFHLELNGTKYYASQVVESNELIKDDKYIQTDASLYDYEYYMYDFDYKSFHAAKDKHADKIKLESSDSIKGYVIAIKKGETIPPIRMDCNTNTFIRFNFEEFVDKLLHSHELDPDSFEEYKSKEDINSELIGANIYQPIE